MYYTSVSTQKTFLNGKLTKENSKMGPDAETTVPNWNTLKLYLY